MASRPAALSSCTALGPRASPGRSAVFDSSVHGVPGSIAAMGVLLLSFIVIAGICGVIARGASAGDKEAGR